MTPQRLKRKFYKLTHPVVGEVWMLHRVVERRSEKPEQRELEVTPEWLEKEILKYQRKGYTFIPIDSILTSHFSLFNSRRFICLTFDDGYRDNRTLAYPLLKRLGIPFTVYVSTGFLDNRSEMWWYPGEALALSTEELLALDADPLCTIGAHTVSHPKLDTLGREQQQSEIKTSKDDLERLLGHSVRHLSFPHGAHNDATLAICRQLGFATAAQSWGGPFRRGEKPWPLPRINKIQS